MSFIFAKDLEIYINHLPVLVKALYSIETAEPDVDWNGAINVRQVVTAHDSEDFACGTDVTGKVNRDIVADMIDQELRELDYAD